MRYRFTLLIQVACFVSGVVIITQALALQLASIKEQPTNIILGVLEDFPENLPISLIFGQSVPLSKRLAMAGRLSLPKPATIATWRLYRPLIQKR